MDPQPLEPRLQCGVCGHDVRALARFCDACGSLIGPRHPRGERKTITVLFVDVVGSMKLAAVLDSERLREIMTELLNRSAAAVQRYQGMVDKFTGDGLMALFGAPQAWEDHALRACIAALEIQSAAQGLAAEVRQRDGVDLRIRVGLNSGQVIAGEIGSGPGGYTAVGHAVGMAQRMESAARPGAVLCSESTVRLVSDHAVFGPVESVTIKGVDEPVLARQLERVESDSPVVGRDDGPLIGRDDELARLLGAFDDGQVSIAGVVGEAGVGKSRLIRELAAAAAVDGDPIIVRCESHTATVPLHALSRLLRAMFGIRGLERAAARAHIADQLRSASSQPGDREVLFDLLSIGEPDNATKTMTAEARRHQLVDVMRRFAASRPGRILFIVDDVHWVDPASEAILARFAESLVTASSMFISGFRPEYDGQLRRMSETTITLGPLDETAAVALANELVGRHPSVDGIADRLALSAAGNPFFIEEMVRDLADRGLLVGSRAAYRLSGTLDAIGVPATVQSVLAARIDRLSHDGKAIVNAAAVIGSSFDLDVLRSLVVGVDGHRMQGLLFAELVDQTAHLPLPRYMFRHPLVRAVAYDSQLLATRADSHRRLAEFIRTREPAAVEKNSGLIAQHLEAAGDLAAAHGWYMRSADWLAQRDIRGAQDSWERARAIADSMPAEAATVIGMRIAPRAHLALTEWMVSGHADGQRNVDELRVLTAQSGDSLPLALALSGRLTALIVHEGKVRDAAVMAAELMHLYDETAGTATERAELLMAVAFAQYGACQLTESLETTERLLAIGPELTVDDVAPAMAMAAAIKCLTGRSAEGRRDFAEARRIGQASHALNFSIVVGYQIDPVQLGFDLVDAELLRAVADAVRMAEAFGDPYALALARYTFGTALLRSADPRRTDGVRLLQLSRADGLDIGGSNLDAEICVETVRHGGPVDEPIVGLLDAITCEMDDGDLLFVGHSTAVLVRLLLARRAPGDVDLARDIVARLESELEPCAEQALQLWPWQCRALLARADGHERAYRNTVNNYRDLAQRLDAQGHLAEVRRMSRD